MISDDTIQTHKYLSISNWEVEKKITQTFSELYPLSSEVKHRRLRYGFITSPVLETDIYFKAKDWEKKKPTPSMASFLYVYVVDVLLRHFQCIK